MLSEKISQIFKFKALCFDDSQTEKKITSRYTKNCSINTQLLFSSEDSVD